MPGLSPSIHRLALCQYDAFSERRLFSVVDVKRIPKEVSLLKTSIEFYAFQNVPLLLNLKKRSALNNNTKSYVGLGAMSSLIYTVQNWLHDTYRKLTKGNIAMPLP